MATPEDWKAKVEQLRKMNAEGNTFCNPASQENWEELVANYDGLYCAICPAFGGFIGVAGAAGTIRVWCETPNRKSRVLIMPEKPEDGVKGNGTVCNGSCDFNYLHQ